MDKTSDFFIIIFKAQFSIAIGISAEQIHVIKMYNALIYRQRRTHFSFICFATDFVIELCEVGVIFL